MSHTSVSLLQLKARAETVPEDFLAWLMYSIPVHGAPPKILRMTVSASRAGARRFAPDFLFRFVSFAVGAFGGSSLALCLPRGVVPERGVWDFAAYNKEYRLHGP